MGEMDKVSNLGAGMGNAYQMNQSFAVWRILVGALVIIAFYALGLFGVGFVLNGWIGFDFAQSPTGTLLVFLASFIPIWLATGAVTRVFFGFSLPHLYGHSGAILWADFRMGFVYIFALILVLEGAIFVTTWIIGAPPYMRNLEIPMMDWLTYLVPIIVLIFLQIGAEELFFRGYLLRLVYSRKASLFWAVYVPSLLFGLAHLDPITYGLNSVFYVLNTTVTGVVLCFITLWRGNIAMAMGIHFAVNTFALLILVQSGSPIGSGGSIWLSTIAPQSVTLGVTMVLITVVEIVLYSIWARHRYGGIIPTRHSTC
jgi:membrane protease YdiL (CAAX protease family)